MLVHWMERRPRAPMRLSATSIEGACLRSGAWPLASPRRPAPSHQLHGHPDAALTPPWRPTMAGWARCESEVLRVRCMQVRRRDLRSEVCSEVCSGGGGESDAKAAATSALIVAEVRGCHLPLLPAPVTCPCHLLPPQVTLRLHTGRTHQLRAQVSHPCPPPARPSPPQPAPSPPPARCAPCLWPAAQSTCKHALPACLHGSWVSSATPCSATRCMARHRCSSCASCVASTPHRRGRSLPSLWRGCLRGPSRCTLGSSGSRDGRPSPRI